MGEQTQHCTAGTATRGWVTSSTRASTAPLGLAGLMAFSWACVGHTLATGMPAVWVVAASTAALTSSIALTACVCLRIARNMLRQHAACLIGRMEDVTGGHADRMEAITDAYAERSKTMMQWHAGQMREQINDLNWLTVANARGKARAHIDAAQAIGGQQRNPSGTGPLSARRFS